MYLGVKRVHYLTMIIWRMVHEKQDFTLMLCCCMAMTGCGGTEKAKEASVKTEKDTETREESAEPEEKEAGLYNLDGEMIKDWETLLAEDFWKVEDGVLEPGRYAWADVAEWKAFGIQDDNGIYGDQIQKVVRDCDIKKIMNWK